MAATRLGLFGVTLLALLLAAGASPAQAQAGSKCSFLKLKAAGAYFKAQTRCRAKAVRKGLLSDPVCVANASDRLALAISNAELRGDCLSVEGDLPVTETLEDAGEDVGEILAPVCCALSTSCAWLSEARCVAFSGTPAAHGSVCSGSGGCVPAPAASGACCENSFVFSGAGRRCIANIAQGDCETTGGTHLADAVCEPSQQCEAP